ncbi:hypothetical protein [Flavobacterium sp. 3HN19-14]|uniref:hypothetical protein n=1 Tax=Flavobacterium sp. 3HN19-14 TaxID=3448133 RepID=UPI003EE29F4B
MSKLHEKISQILNSVKGNESFGYSYEHFQKDYSDQKKRTVDFKFVNSYLKRHLKFEKEYLEFLTFKNFEFVETLHRYFDRSEKASMDYNKKSYSYKALNDFWKIYLVISNNFKSMADLHLNGMDYQAKAVFRNTIELTELCICVLGDEEFYSFFKKQTGAIQPENEFQTIKFGTAKKTTAKVIDSLKNIPSNNIPGDLWDHYLNLRQNFYEESSRYAHSNFLNIFFSSYVKPIESKFIDKEILLMNLGGYVNERTKQNINNIVIYDTISFIIILILMIENHKLPFSKFGENYKYSAFLSKLNWDLFAQLYFKKNYS